MNKEQLQRQKIHFNNNVSVSPLAGHFSAYVALETLALENSAAARASSLVS